VPPRPVHHAGNQESGGVTYATIDLARTDYRFLLRLRHARYPLRCIGLSCEFFIIRLWPATARQPRLARRTVPLLEPGDLICVHHHLFCALA